MRAHRLKLTALVVCLLLIGLLTSLSPATAAPPASTDGSPSLSALAARGNGKKKTPSPTPTATTYPASSATPTQAPTNTPLPTSTPTRVPPTSTATTVPASPTATTTPTLMPSPTAIPTPGGSALTISGISANFSTLPQYEKFELTFDVPNTVATSLQFPFDPSLPPGLEGESGITVEGQFLPPGQTDWQQALRQPGFLFQDYQRQQINGSEWLYPQGRPVWMVRFAPKTQGVWRYRVRAQDASNYPDWTESPTFSFTVGSPNSGNHGFVEVSEADSRYFAFSDGTTFVGQGHGSSFSTSNFTYDADQQLATYSTNGIDFVRVWMTGSNIAGSAWGPWVWFNGPGYGGYLQDPGLAVAPGGSDYDFAFNLNQQAGRTAIFNGWSQGKIAVKPNTRYQLSVTAQASNVAGPRDGSRPGYGFTVKIGGWPSSVPDGLAGYPNLVPYLHNSGWTTLRGTVSTNSSQYFLDYVYLLLDNTASGEVNVGNVSLREMTADGSLGPEILAKSSGDAHKDFNLLRSWDWDYALDQAAQKGVYLKLVTLEKNDRVWNRINLDGTMSGSDDNNNNFYAAPNTKVRRLQEYYWRYLAARWGYSTAVHSWELINEGDPYNGNHYDQANSFARYMHETEPSRHLVTTSLWHSFPAAELWGNPQYSDVDYADLHAYISTGMGNYEWSAPSSTALETNAALTYQGSPGALRLAAGATSGSKTIPIRGRGEWKVSAMVKADGVVGSCPYGASPALAGPQILLGLDSPNTRVIPADAQNPSSYWTCTSPAGTYDYKRIEGTITVPDDNWHRLTLTFKNSYSTSGTVWFDNLAVQSPDGRTARLYGNGTFDDRERMDYDTALYTQVFSHLDGASAVSGPRKPVVRGEAGIDYAGGPQQELPDLARDVRGVWLHNYLWGKLNSGGLYELYWWTENIRKNNLYFQFKPIAEFLGDIPLGNGRYRDAQARPSNSSIAATGQIDASAGNAHLWIRNKNHTWRNVVDGAAWGSMAGTVAVSGFTPNQSYQVEWWLFDDPGNLTLRSETVSADNSGNVILNLASLPSSVTDTAVKIGN